MNLSDIFSCSSCLSEREQGLLRTRWKGRGFDIQKDGCNNFKFFDDDDHDHDPIIEQI